MTQKIYIVDGRQFKNAAEYNRAMRDKKIIDQLRLRAEKYNAEQLRQLKKDVHSGKFGFNSVFGQEFEDELEKMINQKNKSIASKKEKAGKRTIQSTKNGNKKTAAGKDKKENSQEAYVADEFVKQELERREKRRKRIVFLCSMMAIACFGYFGVYSYFDYKTGNSYNELSALKDKPIMNQNSTAPVIHYTLDEEVEPKEVLDEYKNLLNKNKRLIGWVKIDDTNIDYPVMQTTDNEYYLNHNLNQEYDKNGSIFMDKDCNVLNPSTNYILYGHHMKNGNMFGNLHLYGDEKYYEKHKYIQFDTIYEKGTYEVMYVFRSRVYSEEEIVFKYYQFIDALSEQEFDSNMKEMASLSMYDTGVTASYGDHLLTLSTCDYQEKDGRFVVVAKKVTKE